MILGQLFLRNLINADNLVSNIQRENTYQTAMNVPVFNSKCTNVYPNYYILFHWFR